MYLINYFCPFTYQPFGYLAQFRLVVWQFLSPTPCPGCKEISNHIDFPKAVFITIS
jgi:hypothetical protein